VVTSDLITGSTSVATPDVAEQKKIRIKPQAFQTSSSAKKLPIVLSSKIKESNDES